MSDPSHTPGGSTPGDPPSQPMPQPTPQPAAAPEGTGQPAQPLPYATPVSGAVPPYLGPIPNQDSRNLGMLAHLLGIFTGFIGPLIIWMVKKDTDPFVDDQGKESLNFQITMMIGWVISFVLAFVCIGYITGFGLWVVNLVFCIQGCMTANKGEPYRYPFALRLIK